MTAETLRLDDNLMVGESVPPKLTKAMAVIATTLHQTFDAQPWIKGVGWSKQSCVLCALAVRDFLRAIGFADAEVRSVCAVMAAARDGKPLHSLGIGAPPAAFVQPAPKAPEDRFDGHLVTVLTRERVLIDATLFLAKRPAWPHLPGIIAVSLSDDSLMWHDMPAIAGWAADDLDGDYRFTMLWLNRPCNAWRYGGDAKERWRRKPAVDAMIEAFGRWED